MVEEKIEYLKNLYEKFGDFEVTCLKKDGAVWKEWKKYSEIREDNQKLQEVNARSIFPEEVVIDVDKPENIIEIIQKLNEDNRSYEWWKTGSRGDHIHMIFEELKSLSPEARERTKEAIIRRYGGDVSKKANRTMIALELAPHFKTGQSKTWVSKEIGDKNIITSECLVKEKIECYPKKSLKESLETIKKWLYVEKDEDVEIILAVALDRKISGEPCWLFVVAPPSNTKTEILRSLADGEMFYQLSTLTTNSFISGYIKSDGKKVDDLARQIDGKVLVIKDFTSILSMNKDKRDEIFGQLRDAYDGYISRKLGNIDKKITIQTSFGVITGVTPIIDRYYSVMGQLGERFLKLRLDYDDDKILDKTEENEGKEEQMRKEVTEAVMGLLTNIEIKPFTFSDEGIKKIKLLSKWVAKMRTPVSSKWEGDDLVLDINPQSEKPARLYKQLKKLAIALANLRGETSFNDAIYGMLKRVAIDTAPPDRVLVWNYLHKNGSCREQGLIDDLRIHRTTLQRILSSMHRLKLLDSKKEDYENVWSISSNAFEKGLGSVYSGGQDNQEGCPPKKAEGNNSSPSGVNIEVEEIPVVNEEDIERLVLKVRLFGNGDFASEQEVVSAMMRNFQYSEEYVNALVEEAVRQGKVFRPSAGKLKVV